MSNHVSVGLFLHKLIQLLYRKKTPNNRGDGKNGNFKSYKSNGREKIQN